MKKMLKTVVVIAIMLIIADITSCNRASSYLKIEGTVVTGIKDPTKVPAHVKIPNGITEIEAEAFRVSNKDEAYIGSKAVKTVLFPKSLKKIGKDAFYKCTYLESIEIQDGLEEICSGAFSETALKNVTIPGSVEAIDVATFASCESLTSVKIEEGVKKINDGRWKTAGAFQYCTSLKSVTISGSVMEIGGQAFMGCMSLESVNIEEGVTKIGEGVFDSCTSLTSIMLPSSMTEIRCLTFSNCTSLESVTFADINGWWATDAVWGHGNAIDVSTPTTNAKKLTSSGARNWLGYNLNKK